MAAESLDDITPSEGPAIKCSYCRKVIEDNDKNDMGFETDDWAVCFKCFRKICDRVGGKK